MLACIRSNLLALVVLGALPGLAPGQIRKLEPHPYFPLDVGNTWHYRAGNIKVTSKVLRHVVVDDKEYALLETRGKRSKPYVEYLHSDGVRIFRYRVGEDVVDPPLLLLDTSVGPGGFWQWQSTVKDVTVDARLTVQRGLVIVPAGRFNALTVNASNAKLGDRPIPLEMWFAEGVGLVKQRFRAGNYTITLELESVELSTRH